MVGKKELVEKLKSIGLDATLRDGVPMVYGTDNIKAVKKAIKDFGYDGSYGCTNMERKDSPI